ncbi:MAG: trypsin-like peptidase domain-containing protein [Clostridiales bacterium]|nr:trypsin-like peptidase domain-containing protein [Clostridiales bacterium]
MSNMKHDDINENNRRRFPGKTVSLGLCAVLAGGMILGNGSLFAESVSADSGNEEVWLSLLTNEEESSETEETAEEAVEEDSSSDSASLDVSDIVEEAMPSIVAITTKSVQEVQEYYSYNGYGYYYQDGQEQEVQGSGSGFIIQETDDTIFIATNYHVVEDADTLSVAFADDSAYEGTVKGYDEDRDIAVVTVSIDDVSEDTLDAISVAKIGDSDALKLGEQVVAIGNALGYGQTVTTGIVSAKNRRIDSSSGAIVSNEDNVGVNLIQTDAAINPGNSGGALLNMNGEVVGITSAKLASTEVEGMGYAIAISDIADTLEQIMNEETREVVDNHGILGITCTTVNSTMINYGYPEGVFVSEVTEGGPADEAGITPYMIITEFEGKSISAVDQLIEYLTYYAPGEEVTLTVQVLNRSQYEEETITVTLGEDTSSDIDTTDETDMDDIGKAIEDDEMDESDEVMEGESQEIPDQGTEEEEEGISLFRDYENR